MDKQILYRHCELLQLVVCSNESVSDNPYNNSVNPSSTDFFKVSVKDEPPWSFESPPGSGCFCGISITILAVIGQKLGLRLSLRAENPDWPIYTATDGTRYTGGMAEMLLGYVNMSIRAYSVTTTRKTQYSMVSTYLVRVYSAAVHQRWLTESGTVTNSIMYALLYAPMIDLWPILLTAMISIVCVITWLQYVRRKNPLPGTAKALAFGSIGCMCLQAIFNVLASFFGQGEIKKPERFSGAQVAVMVWLMSAYFTTTLMYTHVSSSLTGSLLIPPFHTMLDFVRSDFSPLLMSSGNSEMEFMNSSALKPVLKRIRRCDYTPPFDTRIHLVANMSQTDKLVVFITDEKPLFQKAGFISAVPSAYDTFVSVYQMPLESRLERNVTHMVKWMAATGTLKRVTSVHKDILYRAYGISFTPDAKPLKSRDAASIRMEALFSMGYMRTGLFCFAAMLFLAELVSVHLHGSHCLQKASTNS